MTAPAPIQIAPGLVCSTTWGLVQGEFHRAMLEMRSTSEKNGLTNVGWATVPGTLVEKARNDAVRMMLASFEGKAQWLVFVDGDMVPPADGLLKILTTAFSTHPWADVVGGYCSLRGELSLPTIDTGTGTWESIYPGRGVVEVMRTGAAFLLVKRHVFDTLPQPWFRVRDSIRPLDFMAEVDNWARIKFDGKNPFRGLKGRPWEILERLASEDPSSHSFTPIEVGEDSGFCDRVKNAGFRIVVNTDLEIPHLDQSVATWRKHKEAMDNHKKQWLQAVGIA